MFYRVSSIRISDVKDGTSNTVMGSEALVRPPDVSRWGWGDCGCYWLGGRWGELGFTTLQPPNTPLPDRNYRCKSTSYVHAPCESIRGRDEAQNFARSFHAGGVHALMGDGSVRFVTESIDVTTWRALGTRRGGEMIGEF